MSNIKVADDIYVDDAVTFDSLNLDPRISQAIKQLGFKNPTLIQSKAIPLAVEDKSDIIAKASTGSGKTAAYLLPILHSILQEYGSSSSTHEIKAVIFVPTRELSNQVNEFAKLLLKFCGNLINVLNLSNNYNNQVLKTFLDAKPEILITTPNKFLKLIEGQEDSDPLLNISDLQESLRFITLDEVDLILSYGYQEDLNKIVELLNLSKLNVQTFLMSATLTDDITVTLKETFCKNPKILKLNDEQVVKNKDKLIQYYIKTSEFDKFLLIFIILKLNLIKGKILLFVNNIERGYRLKLFLEQFGVKSCILNSELPINSRLHIIDQYNKNYYNLLIATDDVSSLEADNEGPGEIEVNQNGEPKTEEHESKKENDISEKQITKNNTKSNTNKSKSDKEFGVSRGVDFKNVACVLNFDLPTTSKNYIHRIGRTARANKSGIALSFVVNSKDWGSHRQSSLLTAKKDEKIFARILNKQQKLGLELLPYKFNKNHLDSFRYRVEDAFRSVTGTAIREARIKELKQEILTSDKLKRHFEENPQDLQILRHDKDLHATRTQSHLKSIPNYLLPEGMKADTTNPTFVPFNKVQKNRKRHGKKMKKRRGKDPLKTFKSR
ncbi:ATP-dependent DNA/RNA helicase [Saccharomycopsis crataegensis]|uniref:ATP-dependent RNA helicase DBP9 n=1 Tax=Saccharomycopsis crataegensis TaxID=43959 RepID=A0AAV5QM92_9ASCO|nr:ATP-dependent DNA/RNA helicase [Saccharomycopsis crataegensis]